MGTPEGILGQQHWQGVKEKQNRFAAGRTGSWALNVVRPSIFTRKASRPQLRPTAYLDGLRGFAALLVYLGHHELWAHTSMEPERIFENVYGYEGQYYFVTLPGVKLLFSGGHFAVAVFFVMSGYVLSLKPLQYIHAGEHLKLGDNLSAALFKRWLRLFLPIIAVTLLYMASWHVLGIKTDTDTKSSLTAEFWEWYQHFKNYSWIYHDKPGFKYSFHVWSIATEFRGSIVVYTSLLAFSRSSRNARLLCSIGLIYYFMYIVDGWYCAMFIMGMLQCDLDLLAEANDLPQILKKMEGFRTPIFYTLFGISIYLGGCPASNPDFQVLLKSPGWYYLSFLKANAIYDYKWFFLFFAASMLVASIRHIPLLRSFFELRFNQYLGRISFSFYLVHGPLIWTVSDRIYAAVGCARANHATTAARWINLLPLPSWGPVGLEVNFLAAQLLILPISLWCGEIVMKLFDEPSLRFAQWFYRKTLPSTEKA